MATIRSTGGVRYRMPGEYISDVRMRYKLADHDAAVVMVAGEGFAAYHEIEVQGVKVAESRGSWTDALRAATTHAAATRVSHPSDLFAIDSVSGDRHSRARCRKCGHVTDWFATSSSAMRAGRQHQGATHPDDYLNTYGRKPLTDARVKQNLAAWGVPVGDDTSRKDTNMKTIAQINTELELAQARLEHLLAEKSRLERMPADPGPGVIAFDIRFPGNDTKYSYAAVRARGLWWVTGRDGARGRSWTEMLEFMSQDADVIDGEPIVFRHTRRANMTKVAGS